MTDYQSFRAMLDKAKIIYEVELVGVGWQAPPNSLMTVSYEGDQANNHPAQTGYGSSTFFFDADGNLLGVGCWPF